MFRNRKIILPFVATILFLFFTSMEAHLFLAQLDFIEEIQEERETEKEVDELREWETEESKWLADGGGGDDFIAPCHFAFQSWNCQNFFIKVNQFCIHTDFLKSALYILYCTLKIAC